MNLKEKAREFYIHFILNPIYIIPQIIFAFIAYGFYANKRILNVDTLRGTDYFKHDYVAQKRATWALISRFLMGDHIFPGCFSPLAVVFLLISALLFGFLLYCVSGRKEDVVRFSIATSIFCVFPLWCELLVYSWLQSMVPFQLMMALCAVIYTYVSDSPNMIIASMMMLLAGLGYEVAFSVYITIVLIVLFDRYINDDAAKSFIKPTELLHYLLPLVVAFVVRSIINNISFRLFANEAFEMDSMSINWFSKGVQYSLNRLLYNAYYYYIRAFEYFPIGVFLFSSIVFAIVVIYYFIIRRKKAILFWGIILYASLFLMSILQGQEMPYRVGVAGIAFFVSYTVYLAIDAIKCLKVQIISRCLLIYLCLMMSLNTNYWLAVNWQRSENEIAIARQIGYRLVSEFEHKEVVFVGELDMGDYIDSSTIAADESFGGKVEKWFRKNYTNKTGSDDLYKFDGAINYSVINWARKTSHVGQRYMGYYLSYLGYDIVWDESVDWDKLDVLTKEAEKMNMHPLEIRDMGNYILVYLG